MKPKRSYTTHFKISHIMNINSPCGHTLLQFNISKHLETINRYALDIDQSVDKLITIQFKVSHIMKLISPCGHILL